MNSIFELDFSRQEILLLFLVPALINIGLFIYTLFFLTYNRVNHAFSIYVLIVGLWQMAECFARLNTGAEGAREWFSLVGVLAIFATPFGMLFALYFFNPGLRIPRIVFVSQFIPAILASFAVITGSEQNVIEASADWYWVLHPSPTAVNYIIYTWISIDGLIMLGLLWWKWNSERKKHGSQKKYALLMAVGFTVPMLGGIAAEVLYPLVANSSSLPITTALFTVFSIACLVSILQYNMLEYSPKHQWGGIVEKLNEGIIIIDKSDRIMYANNAFRKTLGYEDEDIKGVLACSLFKNRQGRSMTDILLNDESRDFELRRKDGRHKWVVISGSPYLNNKGKIIGAIGIFTNINNLKKAEMDIVMEKEKLQLAIDAGKMATLEVDFISKKAFLSENAIHVLGVDSFTDKESFAKAIHPDDLQKIMDSIRDAYAGEIGELQFRFRRPDTGKYIWLERRAKVIYDASGKVTGMRGVLMDVTGSKATETKLFQSTERLKAIFDNEPECVTVVNLQGHIEDINPAGLEMLELAAVEEVMQMPIIDFVHPDDREVYMTLHHEVSRGSKDTADFRIVGRNGAEKWMESNAVPLRRPNGEIYAVLSVCRDITEIKRKADEILMMKEYLEKNEKGLKQAQKIARMGSWESNYEMTDIRWSDEFYEILGMQTGEIPSTIENFLSFVHPGDIDSIHELIRKSNISHKDYSFNCRIVRKDKTERYIYTDCRFEFDEDGKEPVSMYGIIQDITEQKLTEIKLQKSTDRLIEAQGIARVGHWEINFANNVATWSDEAYRIYGVEPGDHKFSFQDWLAFIHPDDMEDVLQCIDYSHTTLTSLSMEHRIITRQGVTRYIHSQAKFEFDKEGKPVGLIGVAHDITESKTNEIKLQNLLQLTNDQNKRLQNFTYIVSHNIRSHSANISGLVDMLEEVINNNSEFAMLKSSSEKLAETIHNLNGIIAIQTELDKERSVMNLKDEIGKSLSAINSQVSQSGAVIDIEVGEDISVEVVPSYLESILLNLLTNAVKYRSTDKVLEICLGAEVTEEHIILSVKDNGIGINLEKYGSSIFGMYKTFHNNADAKGLGLFIVKNQIEAMNGRIEVESQPGNGCTYRVYFCRTGYGVEIEQKNIFLSPMEYETRELTAKVV